MRTTRKPQLPKHAALVTALADAFKAGAHATAEPLINETFVPETKTAQVVVIWQRWATLTPQQRSDIIARAFAAAKVRPGATLTVAMGLTPMEALSMGFLPYAIVTTHRKGDAVGVAQLTEAMKKAGGVQVKVGPTMQLRFATAEQAQTAYRQLSTQIPGPYWAIEHAVPVEQ